MEHSIIHHITGIATASWSLMVEAAPYIILGMFAAGLIRAFIPEKKIKRYLGQNRFRSVVLGSLFGLPLPLCSCGVVPTAIALRKQGASKSAILAFLISTPETGIDSITMTYALIDPLMAIARPVAAFITAMVAGISELLIGSTTPDSHQPAPTCPKCHAAQPASVSLGAKLASGFRFAFFDLLSDISKWFLIGIIIAGIISYLVPNEMIEHYLNAGPASLFIMLVIGIPLYICASASTPIAAALILKGASPGAILVFLLAGPATNIASILVLRKELGDRSIAIYLMAIAICSVSLGLLINHIYLLMPTLSATADLQHINHQHMAPWHQWLAMALTLVMVGMVIRNGIKKS